MVKFDFRKIFGWFPWITLFILIGWISLFIIDVLKLWEKTLGIFVILFGLMLFTFAVDSLMKENPQYSKKYFIEWMIVCGMFIFFALSIYIWYL
ncbi:MAG: hypothetical protein ACFFD2_11130 [Promethearchaeota archaeon]